MAECKPKDNHSVAKTVLVVDDDWLIREVITLALDDAGYGVVASDGIDAPELARQAQPAVVLLDINMPVMDGVEVRRHLHADPATAHIPVIALSAATNLRARAAEMEANDYLAKPFDLAELLLRIERWAGPAE
jgi:CheY-like chemotaxis protein